MVSEVKPCLLTSALPSLLENSYHQLRRQMTAITELLDNVGSLLPNIFLRTWTANKFFGFIQ